LHILWLFVDRFVYEIWTGFGMHVFKQLETFGEIFDTKNCI